MKFIDNYLGTGLLPYKKVFYKRLLIFSIAPLWVAIMFYIFISPFFNIMKASKDELFVIALSVVAVLLVVFLTAELAKDCTKKAQEETEYASFAIIVSRVDLEHFESTGGQLSDIRNFIRTFTKKQEA